MRIIPFSEKTNTALLSCASLRQQVALPAHPPPRRPSPPLPAHPAPPHTPDLELVVQPVVQHSELPPPHDTQHTPPPPRVFPSATPRRPPHLGHRISRPSLPRSYTHPPASHSCFPQTLCFLSPGRTEQHLRSLLAASVPSCVIPRPCPRRTPSRPRARRRTIPLPAASLKCPHKSSADPYRVRLVFRSQQLGSL